MCGDMIRERRYYSITIMRCSFYTVRWFTICLLCVVILRLRQTSFFDDESSASDGDAPLDGSAAIFAHKRLGEWVQEDFEDNKYLPKGDEIRAGAAQIGGNGIYIEPSQIEIDGVVLRPDNMNHAVLVKGGVYSDLNSKVANTTDQKNQDNNAIPNDRRNNGVDITKPGESTKGDERPSVDGESGLSNAQKYPPHENVGQGAPAEPIQKSEVNKAGNGKKGMKKVGPLYMPRKDPCTHPKSPSALSKTKYTLLMLIHGKCKWKQLVYDLTLESMKRLDQVVLLWNNDWLPPKELLEVKIREGGPRVVIIKMAHNSMNNRFMPWSPIRTAAVYILDMDIRLPGEALEFAFDNWLLHQGSIVGYAYRRFYANGTYPDRARARIFGPDPGYNFVLTGSAMMSYELLRQYACEDKTKRIREMVDEMFNGDDIAMNMISRYNGHRPIALTRNSPELEDPRDDQNKTGCLYDLGVNGRAGRRKIFKSKSISTRTGHAMKRQDMFMKFADHLGLSHDMSIHQDFYQPPLDVDLCTCATIPPAVMRGK